jgi:hypothetical protein
MTLPEPPVNVHLVLVDGTVVPVDTVYVGVHQGSHHWQVVQGPPLEQVQELRIDQLPPSTTVTIGEGYAGG